MSFPIMPLPIMKLPPVTAVLGGSFDSSVSSSGSITVNGPNDVGRHLVLVQGRSSTGSISPIVSPPSVNGVLMELVAQQSTTYGSDGQQVAIYATLFPVGSSASLTGVTTGGNRCAQILAFSVYGLSDLLLLGSSYGNGSTTLTTYSNSFNLFGLVANNTGTYPTDPTGKADIYGYSTNMAAGIDYTPDVTSTIYGGAGTNSLAYAISLKKF